MRVGGLRRGFSVLGGPQTHRHAGIQVEIKWVLIGGDACGWRGVGDETICRRRRRRRRRRRG